MKKELIMLSSLLCLSGVAALGDEEEPRFFQGEWDVSPFVTYVDKVGDDWGGGTSLTYFITDRIGVGAYTFWTHTGGTLFDNAAGEAYFRLPLFRNLAPYAVGSVGYQFDDKEWFETLGVGIDFRPFNKFSAFSDIQYRFANENRDGIFIRLGLRFAL